MKHNKRFILVAALVLLATLLIAGAAMADPIKTITFAPTPLEVKLDSGESKNVLVDATDAAALVKPTIDPATPDPFYLRYSVDNTDVAEIINDWWDEVHFTVRSKKPGTVKVTVKVFDQATDDYLTEGSFTVNFTEVPITSITSNAPAALEVKADGAPLDLLPYISVEPTTGTTYSKNNGLIWSTSNNLVATVNSNGRVEGKKAGPATITATVKGHSDLSVTFNITVTETPIKGITVNPAAITMQEGMESYWWESFNVTIEPNDATGGIKISSSDPATVNISGSSLVAKKPGTATITFYSEKDPTIKAEATVTVEGNHITGLAFTKTALTLNIRDDVDLDDYLTVSPVDYNNWADGIKWTSSDITVATVSDGDVTLHKPGTVTITASAYEDPTIKAECTITVEAINATAVAFNQSAIEVEQSNNWYDTSLLNMIKVAPVDANRHEITFSTSDRDIVELNYEYGTGYYFLPAKVGTATITATWKNWDDTIVTGTMTVTVKAPKIESFAFTKTEYKVTNADGKYVDLGRRLIVKPDDRKFFDIFGDDPDNLIWESDDETVAYVDNSGCVWPVHAGTATITVTYGYDETIKATATVTVTDIPVKKIALNKTVLELTATDSSKDTVRGNRVQLTYSPGNAYIKEVYWTLSDTNYVQFQSWSLVDNGGPAIYGSLYVDLIPTGKAGTATLTAHVNDGVTVHEATCEIKVSYPSIDVSLENAKVTLSLVKDKSIAANNQYYFSAWNTLLNNNPDDDDEEIDARSFKWSSSDKSVAKINKSGKITVLKKGKTTITGTYKKDASVTVTCEVTVTQTKIKSISAIDRTIRVGQVIDLFGGKSSEGVDGWIVLLPKQTATVRIFNPELKITSSKKAVVSIKNGKLSGLKPGTSKITVKAQDGSKKKTTFKVTVIDNTDVEFPEN